MIALAADCLLFKMASGETIPFSAEMVSVELMGDTANLFDAEFVRHASHAVFHYFKHELGLKTVSVADFAGALEKVLRGFALTAKAAQQAAAVLEADLGLLASRSEGGCELFFFPLLREELRQKLSLSPRLLRFRGLRSCVKQLMGARKWTVRCQGLEEQIVEYLRQCLNAQPEKKALSLVVQ